MDGRASSGATRDPARARTPSLARGPTRTARGVPHPLLVALAIGVVGCGETPIVTESVPDPESERFPGCDLEIGFLFAGSTRDGIPSLDDPVWDRAEVSVPTYLADSTRVVGLVANGVAHAIPLNVLWHHEIVNFAAGGPTAPRLAVTYCPLTGSSLVYDRASVDGAELGVSGLLFMNNLMMYDRRSPEDTMWPQMLSEARCGSRSGARLEPFPFVEMVWSEWVRLHPSTLVIAGAADQGLDPIRFNYTAFGYPYGIYREREPFFLPNAMPALDPRRFSKERLIGVQSVADESEEDQGIAFPFGALQALAGSFQAVPFEHEGEPAVLLWGDDAEGGGAFYAASTTGEAATMEATDTGFADAETGSAWTVDGRAITGDRAGQTLRPIVDSHTAFWGAWAAFHPGTELWTGS